MKLQHTIFTNTFFSIAVVLFGLAMSLNAAAITGVASVSPINPKANEPVELVVEVPKGLKIDKVRLINSVFVVNLITDPDPPAILVPRMLKVILGRLPEGNYRASTTVPFTGALRDELAFTVQAKPVNLDGSPSLGVFDVVGLWWDPSKAGDGFTFSRVGNDELFGTLFVSTRQTTSPWFTIQGCRLVENHCVASLLNTQRNVDDTLQVNTVGQAEIRFKSEKFAELTYRIGDAAPVTFKLERLDY